MTTTMAIAEYDRLLCADETRWGQGYGGYGYTQSDMDTIAHNVAPVRQPGHPPRLHQDTPGFAWTENGATLPEGFDILDHPNRRDVSPDLLDVATPTSPDGLPPVPAHLQDYFRHRGWRLDQHGRPLHPHAEQLLADSRIGLPTGPGFAYRLGDTAVADAVAVAGEQVVLVTRQTRHDGLIPALPGGYGSPADEGRTLEQWNLGDRDITVAGVIATARRKLFEETGLAAPADRHAEIVRAIRPVSSVHTLHAWTTVYTVRFTLPARANLTLRPDSGARWCPLGVLTSMWPDHQRAVVAALT